MNKCEICDREITSEHDVLLNKYHEILSEDCCCAIVLLIQELENKIKELEDEQRRIS